MTEETTETGFVESCCFNDIRDQHPRYLPHDPCKCRCHADYPERVTAACRCGRPIAFLKIRANGHIEDDPTPYCPSCEYMPAASCDCVPLERARFYETQRIVPGAG